MNIHDLEGIVLLDASADAFLVHSIVEEVLKSGEQEPSYRRIEGVSEAFDEYNAWSRDPDHYSSQLVRDRLAGLMVPARRKAKRLREKSEVNSKYQDMVKKLQRLVRSLNVVEETSEEYSRIHRIVTGFAHAQDLFEEDCNHREEYSVASALYLAGEVRAPLSLVTSYQNVGEIVSQLTSDSHVRSVLSDVVDDPITVYRSLRGELTSS